MLDVAGVAPGVVVRGGAGALLVAVLVVAEAMGLVLAEGVLVVVLLLRPVFFCGASLLYVNHQSALGLQLLEGQRRDVWQITWLKALSLDERATGDLAWLAGLPGKTRISVEELQQYFNTGNEDLLRVKLKKKRLAAIQSDGVYLDGPLSRFFLEKAQQAAAYSRQDYTLLVENNCSNMVWEVSFRTNPRWENALLMRRFRVSSS